jgi:hypothetical protein
LGGWVVEIDIGARPGEGPVVAELLSAAFDIPGLSFQLEGRRAYDVSEAWRQPGRRFLASTRQLATMLRPPARELPGVALRQSMPFDMNSESEASPGHDLRRVDLGTSLDSALQPSGRFTVATATLNRHALVCGATGSGKTQTVQRLLEQLTAIGIPWLVIEPAKTEYRAMARRLRAQALDPAVHVIRLGDPDAPPLGLNPLEPEPGFPLQTHIDMVAALFVASFDAAEPFPQILAEALRRCYSDLGWSLATGEYKRTSHGRVESRGKSFPRYPTLSDLQRCARDVVHDVGYGKEVRDNVLGFVDVRLGSLRNGTPGRFFEGGHPLDLAAVHRSNVVIEIEDVGNDLDKAFVIGTVVLRVYEHLRVKGPTKAQGLTHITIVEEAHRLLRRTEPGTKPNHAVELFGAMLSEVRAFGEGIVIAEQIPTKILSDVVKNTALQIVHRLPSIDDRMVLAGATNMNDEQSAYVLSVGPGHAAAFREGMDAPVLLRVDHPGPLAGDDPAAAPLGGLRARIRGVGCQSRCEVEPCTARILDVAPQLALSVPELPFWVELLFLAHVSETEIPRPVPVWVSALAQRLDGTVAGHCALASVVEASVHARWAEISDFYDPDALISQMATVADAMLVHGEAPPPTDGFAAGRFFLRPVYDQLLAGGHETAPHHLTDAWRRELGIDLIDAPVPAQRAWLELSALFAYPGHGRLLSGMAPAREGAPASRVEALARPLAVDRSAADAIAVACRRVTRDAQTCIPRLRDWLSLDIDTEVA